MKSAERLDNWGTHYTSIYKPTIHAVACICNKVNRIGNTIVLQCCIYTEVQKVHYYAFRAACIVGHYIDLYTQCVLSTLYALQTY